ncbi:hypothetical protein T07_12438 [Trichinella nelsoni]|uniref:Uncharacterized protein n=1 Tax=Trichinella nelsoni TaxID=6336 RepID=A0A0V0SB72_9BILA|nr:hypothetical protein T07_12438 [Trichinella nelsoni]
MARVLSIASLSTLTDLAAFIYYDGRFPSTHPGPASVGPIKDQRPGRRSHEENRVYPVQNYDILSVMLALVAGCDG